MPRSAGERAAGCSRLRAARCSAVITRPPRGAIAAHGAALVRTTDLVGAIWDTFWWINTIVGAFCWVPKADLLGLKTI